MSLFGAALVVFSGIPTWNSVPGTQGPRATQSESVDELFQTGVYLYTIGSFYASASYFEKCLKKHPDDSMEKQATYWLSLSLIGSGQIPKAQKELEKLVRKPLNEPLMSQSLLSLGDCYRLLGNCRKAGEVYEKVVRTGGSYVPLAMRNKALCLELEGMKADAIRVYQEILLRFPNSLVSAEAREKVHKNGRKIGVPRGSK
ncbi:MAG: tetratricopeptide repeat protein [Candidatus Eisenbacteria bacterium]|nr:tetratricopeptide repeat protein [Candidatus Eisenbacteria bacterium]